MKTLLPYSIVLNLLLLLLLSWFLCIRKNEPCTQGSILSIRHDTIYPNATSLKLAHLYKPVARHRIKRSGIEQPELQAETAVKKQLEASAPGVPCDSIYYYSDTFFQRNDYKAVINDTVAGNQVTGRSVWFVNLKPEIQTTIERVSKERLRVYLGIDFTINARYGRNWGIGPAALLTFPPRFALSYYYDAKNNAHSGGLFVLLKLKK